MGRSVKKVAAGTAQAVRDPCPQFPAGKETPGMILMLFWT